MPITARSEMLIRAPASAAYEAFVHPKWLKKFWLKKASAALRIGAPVQWEFIVPGASETVEATNLVVAEQIAFNWSDGKHVEIHFTKFGRSGTRVSVEVTGFRGQSAAEDAIGATEGFAIVLCDLKSLLERGASGAMVRDKARLIAADK